MTDTKDRLLAVSLALFSQRGYEGVGVQEIVDTAAVTKPTLYHYFQSKRGLLEQLLHRGFSPLEQSLIEAADYQGDLTGSLMQVAGVYFRFIEKNTLFYRFWMSLLYAPDGSEAAQCAQPLMDRQRAILSRMFAKAGEQHGNMKGREEFYSANFLGIINSTIHLVMNHQLVLDDGMVYRILHQFEHGIYS